MINICSPDQNDPVRAQFDEVNNTINLPQTTVLQINPEDYTKHPQCNFNMARAMIADGDLALDAHGHLAAQVDLVGLSPSAARVLVTGMAGSGWDYWRIEAENHPHHGNTISALRNGQQGQPNVDPPEPAAEPAEFVWGNHLLSDFEQGTFYNNLKNQFEDLSRFREVAGLNTLDRDSWPKGAGVYVVWQRMENGTDMMLYVGLAGRIVNDGEGGINVNAGCLAGRLARWHPYCFQMQDIYQNHFEYGPQFSVGAIRIQPFPQRYRHHVPLDRIKVDCFLLSEIEARVSPALIESLILQNHVALNGSLPPANNQL